MAQDEPSTAPSPTAAPILAAEAAAKIECPGIRQEERTDLVLEGRPVVRLRAPIAHRFEGFGSTLAISESWLAISAGGAFADHTPPGEFARPGRIFVYPRMGSELGRHQELRSPKPRKNGDFGTNLALAGRRLLATENDGPTIVIQVFEEGNGTFEHRQTLRAAPALKLTGEMLTFDEWILAIATDTNEDAVLVAYQLEENIWRMTQEYRLGKAGGEFKLFRDGHAVLAMRRYQYSQVNRRLSSLVLRMWQGAWQHQELLRSVPGMVTVGKGWWAASWHSGAQVLDLNRYQEKPSLAVQQLLRILPEKWAIDDAAAAWDHELLLKFRPLTEGMLEQVALLGVNPQGTTQLWSITSPCSHCSFGSRLAGDPSLLAIGAPQDAGTPDAYVAPVCSGGTGSVYLLKPPTARP